MEWRTSEPGRRDVVDGAAIAHFYSHVALPRGHLGAYQLLHGQPQGIQQSGSRPIQGLADRLANRFRWLDADNTKAGSGEMQSRRLSGQAAADDSYIANAGCRVRHLLSLSRLLSGGFGVHSRQEWEVVCV